MILQRYILRELAATFLFILLVTAAVFLVGASFQVFRRLEGLGLAFLLRTMPSVMGYVLPYALLIAGGASATLVYARLSAKNELTAMRTSGIHIWKALAPAVLLGIALGLLSWWINDRVMPFSHYQKRVVIRSSIVELLQSPPAGNQLLSLENYRISYDGNEEGEMRSVFVTVLNDKGLDLQLHAKSGNVDFTTDPPQMILRQCNVKKFTTGGEGEIRTDSDTFMEEYALSLDFGEIAQRAKGPRDMSNGELAATIESGAYGRNHRRLQDARTELFSRWARSAAPLLLVLVCASVGILTRRGSKLAGLGASLPPLLLYFVLSMFGEGAGGGGGISPFAGAFLADAALGVVALGLVATILRQ
ncbi:MAG: hypothetical protein A2Z34_04700 [Planctomycetes bacterium RBG_16_59_8]|nr:MAG: hypothetical protein A2Z34_04700 [Planctomycetes bacterium RBG_16_59_8]